ncbi:MAG: hypothetical protein MZV63_00585 [Marinilabiliales bacterium]|nr:hypothetical protein [Marinilabiliales bacterium]
MNCISTLMTPSPWHSSHRPPSTLNEKCAGLKPDWTAACWSAKSLRMSSKALR